MACAAGEEKHVQALGNLIADKVDQMGGTHSEPRRAAVRGPALLADELHELRERAAARPKPDPARPWPSAWKIAPVPLRVRAGCSR